MYKLPCLKKNTAKTCKHTSKTGFGGFRGKNADNSAKKKLDCYFGQRRRRGKKIEIPWLGGPQRDGKDKKHPQGGSQEG